MRDESIGGLDATANLKNDSSDLRWLRHCGFGLLTVPALLGGL